MNESISRAAGSEQRTTLYGPVAPERTARSLAAEALAEPWNPPAREVGLRIPPRRRLVRREIPRAAAS